MAGSKINPNTWKGEVRSGGYIVRNRKPSSANSPQWKGKYFLEGYGWVWVSGWERRDDVIRLSVQDMSDEHARKFCQQKGTNNDAPQAPRTRPEYGQNGSNPPANDPDEIPF